MAITTCIPTMICISAIASTVMSMMAMSFLKNRPRHRPIRIRRITSIPRLCIVMSSTTRCHTISIVSKSVITFIKYGLKVRRRSHLRRFRFLPTMSLLLFTQLSQPFLTAFRRFIPSMPYFFRRELAQAFLFQFQFPREFDGAIMIILRDSSRGRAMCR
ncbi:hypothetical protein BGZ60DRAFT_406013 [Tricladium varicosporioides]|nr:hypothetical protein BGZ60DRAFT_406013 [Hymenoscyphus varicosporioides]